MSDTSSTTSSEWMTCPTSRRSSIASFVSMDTFSTIRDFNSDDGEINNMDGGELKGRANDTMHGFLEKLTRLSGERGCPVTLNIIGGDREVQEAKQLVGYLDDSTLDPMDVHGITSLGLFLSNAGNPDRTKDQMKKAVRCFIRSIHSSKTAQRQITHLDVGYAPVLTKLQTPTARAYDSISVGEKRLEAQMSLLSNQSANTHNQALLLRLTDWISLALPNIHTLTIHLDKDHLLCTADSHVCYHPDAKGGFMDEIISPFAELQEVNLVCAEPFVALSWSVSQRRVFSSVDRMSEVVQKLRSREYYRYGGIKSV
ncbi:hypothetical protein PRZ48_003504 [Zasmidium cellare]|uniref:Uncharacterized protein n=1 Tax=Zasmidium cellare TaxID=395010 RepID=A0ABR0EWH1_ZASCE|nr:hypothetical protein PRZ48_003504 [Zasmidium cellare]